MKNTPQFMGCKQIHVYIQYMYVYIYVGYTLYLDLVATSTAQPEFLHQTYHHHPMLQLSKNCGWENVFCDQGVYNIEMKKLTSKTMSSQKENRIFMVPTLFRTNIYIYTDNHTEYMYISYLNIIMCIYKSYLIPVKLIYQGHKCQQHFSPTAPCNLRAKAHNLQWTRRSSIKV